MRQVSRGKLAIPLVAVALLPACSLIGAGSGASPSPTAKPAKKAAAPKPTPTPTALIAKDGTDLKACKKADCQVIIRGDVDVPVQQRYGIYQLHLTHSPPNQLTFTVLRTQLGPVNGYLAGTGYVSLANGVTFTVEKMSPKGAVVRFERKALDDDNDKASGSDGLALYGS
ncbi:MAG: hypothetical protein GEV11_06925 [Streptosporangiales bacterium]|nr:hypothetical protein [Streptosporangiales bacterium]